MAVSCSGQTESSTSPSHGLQNPRPAPPLSNLDRGARRRGEKNRGGKKTPRKKKYITSSSAFRLLDPRRGIRPRIHRSALPSCRSVDRSVRGLGPPRGSDLVLASPEEEMNGAGGSHHQQQQQRLRQQQQQQALLMQQALQQQQQYQSGVLAAAAAAAMTQVVPPDPRLSICWSACALGGSNARRSACERGRLFSCFEHFF